MRKSDILAFAHRDWAMLAESKAAHWAKQKKSLGPAEAIRIGDALRRHARALHPGWPTEEDRAQDTATHARVASSLRRVRLRRNR